MSRNPESPNSAGELERSLVRGIAWTGAMKWLSQLLSWASLFIVARLVTPADYGVVGIAALYLGLIGLLSDFGLSAAVITMRDLSEERIAQLHGAAGLFGLLAMGISILAAWPIGWFFRSTEVPAVIMAMSITLLFSGIRQVPSSLMQRDLRFRELALIEAGQSIVSALSTVSLAAMGLGYWALALGSIVGAVFATLRINLRRPHRRAWPRWAAIREPLTLSSHILSGQFSWWVYSNADFAIAGRMLGQSALGAYTLAWEMASVPIEKITVIVTKVTPAYFSALQHDLPALRRQLLMMTQGIAFLTLPLTLGMALVAREFVLVALGDKWTPAIVPLQLLATYASFRSIVTLLPQVLNIKGDTRFTMRMGLLFVLVMPAAFLLGSRWGSTGIAMMWVLVYPVLTIPIFWRTFQRLELRPADYVRSVWPALRGALVMVGGLLILDATLPAGTPDWARLAVKIVAGALAYGLVSILPERERLMRLFKSLRGNQEPAAPAV